MGDTRQQDSHHRLVHNKAKNLDKYVHTYTQIHMYTHRSR